MREPSLVDLVLLRRAREQSDAARLKRESQAREFAEGAVEQGFTRSWMRKQWKGKCKTESCANLVSRTSASDHCPGCNRKARKARLEARRRAEPTRA